MSFLFFHPLRRRCLSLSLSPSGDSGLLFPAGEPRPSVVRTAPASGGIISASFGSPRSWGASFQPRSHRPGTRRVSFQRRAGRPGLGEARFSVIRVAPASGSFVSASSGRGPSPNNALQRTGIGGRAFSDLDA